MAETATKTGITEAALVAAGLSFLEPAVEALTNGVVALPDPWGKFAIGILAVAIYFLRRRQKTAGA